MALHYLAQIPKCEHFGLNMGNGHGRVAEYFGKELGETCYTNFWVPDGFKDTPVDRLAPRKRLMESLDEIFSEEN